MTDSERHWQAAYSAKSAQERSWTSDGGESLRVIMKYKPDRASAVIDVGGGASPLAYKLIEAGYVDVSVVDISQQALDEAHTNAPLGSSATSICADVREWIPTRGYDVWHDRAVLHFLVDDEDRLRYARLATGALNTSGILIVAVFAEDGPEMCSGLPVRRATQDDIVALFGAEFLLEDRFREIHRTPWGAEQPFNWVVLRRN